jgi:diadenosine tetraphosphatase ApaH/serine/threonine PP2A family protein phosphatase
VSSLVLSDLHANGTALAAALAAAEGRWERAVCLGDLVGYGPDPNEVVEKIRDLAQPVIRGNHDKAACGLTDLEDFNPVAGKALMWTRDNLGPANLDYLRELPGGPVVADGLALVHGSVRDEDEYVFSPAQALDSLLTSPERVTFFGHTHFQGGFSYRGERLEVIQLRPRQGANFATLRLEDDTRYMLNPGSIGQPRDGDPRAAFAIADLEHGMVEFWRVPYDIKAVQKRMQAANAPEPLVLRLELGR